MRILQNAYKISLKQRKILAFVAMIFMSTNTQVQAVNAAELSQNTAETAQIAEQAAPAPQAIVVPVNTVDTTVVPEKPVQKQAASDAMRVTLTAYTSEPNQTDGSPFITADGSCVADGVIAANFLPIGTQVRIPELFGDKVFEVHDRMNERYDVRIDVWMKEKTQAITFGLKHAKVEIIQKGNGKKHWEDKNKDADCMKKLENA